MPAPVVLPDIEAVVVAYLRDALAARTEPFAVGVFVGSVLPSPRPQRAVTVRDDGGPRLDDVRGLARVGINVWHESLAEVTDLANLVSALVTASLGHGPIRRVSASRPLRVADESEQPLCYLTAELIVRGVSL